jgi:hypothetical protein
VGRRTV